MTKRLTHGAAAALATLLTSASLPSTASDPGEWEFAVSPMYLWAKSVDATSSAGGRESQLDLDFKNDILENLDAAFALHFEARKDNLSLFLQYNFARLDPGIEKSSGPIDARADIKYDDTLWEGGASWAFAESESIRWELLGGLRYYEQDISIKLSASGPEDNSRQRRVSAGDDWVHPFAGLRVISRLSDRWTLRARADLGYESAENTALQGIATVDYRFRDWGSAFFGYRYLDMDFDNESSGANQYSFDGDQQGPLLGLTVYF